MSFRRFLVPGCVTPLWRDKWVPGHFVFEVF